MSAEVNAASLSTLREKLRAVTNEYLAADDAARLCALARPAVRLTHGERESETHLGGSARLEPGQVWPSLDGRSLALLVVLDMEQVSRFVVDVELPAEGYLNFFYDAEEQSVGDSSLTTTELGGCSTPLRHPPLRSRRRRTRHPFQ